MQTNRERLIYLHHSSCMTRRMLYKVKKYDATLRIIFTLTPSEISQFFLIPMKKALTMHRVLHDTHLQVKVQRDLPSSGIITSYDQTYPKSLHMIPDAPLVLYTLGNQNLLQQSTSISVIGTRKPSYEAADKLVHIVTPLIQKNWLIVSGLAYGIDSMAHELTLHHHGNTIAVLGGGFNHIYPKQNIPLFRNIVQKGLVVTEYPPNTPPKRHHFPERNRIISGLTNGTLVIEATERSGTLITVDQALEQGKEVYAVPGSPLIPQTKGCHMIIQQGAKLVAESGDILEDW